MQEIGFMTNFNQPTELATITALIAKSYDIDLIYLRPKDVDIDSGTVRGKVLNNGKWKTKSTKIPRFIDISPYCFKKKNKEIMDYLRANTFLSDNRENTLSKQKLQDILKEDSNFSHLVIPTQKIKSFEELLNYVKVYKKTVLKPIRGLRGKGVHFLEMENEDTFRIGFETEMKTLNLQELEEFYYRTIHRKGYILQKYVSSRTTQGDPFDCRIHVEKDGSGNWSVAKMYIRIGIGQSIISNVNQGGGISDPKPFLKANFKDNWSDIYDSLKKVGESIPKKMEELRNTHIMYMGMDIGIDRSGKLYLFEVNDGPSTIALISEVAYHRSNYYSYAIRELLDIPDKDRNKNKNSGQIDKLQQEVKQLRLEKAKKDKEINQIKSSTSWKMTSFIRKVGKLLKNK